jgi:hypothetical protein
LLEVRRLEARAREVEIKKISKVTKVATGYKLGNPMTLAGLALNPTAVTLNY